VKKRATVELEVFLRKGNWGMKKFLRGLLVAGFVLVSVTVSSANKADTRGKDWLDAQKEPAAINVNGNWDSDFGLIHLDQTAGSRDVSGSEGKYDLKGVVSGKTLYLLFATGRGGVDYCVVLDSSGDTTLIGHYYYSVTRLRFGHGLCQEKGYAMNLRKR
jgi:hypothetical protein